MTRRCFLVENELEGAARITLRGAAAHHLQRVLRVRAGEPVAMRDGRGGAWLGRVTDVSVGEVGIQILERQYPAGESPLAVTLALAHARSERMEWVVRQATELGVQRLVAFRSARSQYGLDAGRAEKRIKRWSKIAREALCQCGRIQLPEIVLVPDVASLIESASAWLAPFKNKAGILAWEGEGQQGLSSVRGELPECGAVWLTIGPEGGFGEEEMKLFQQAQFHIVRLGPRILRFETAATSLITAAQLLWGDLG
jgi:16S rRNA (uracil1498-N3)-methyltransferase